MEISIKNKPIFFKNKDFKTIQIKVFFPFVERNRNYAMINILPGMLHFCTKNYPTERDLSLALDKNYVLSLFCINNTYGDLNQIIFNMSIPDTYSLNEDYLEKQFELLSEVIYNPKIDNNTFDKDRLDIEINNLRVNIEKTLKDTINYALVDCKKIIDDEGILSSSIYNHMEQIDSINTSNLYDFYLKNIYNNHPLIYIFGNTNNKRITDLCNKYLYRSKFNNYKLSFDSRYYLLPRKDNVVVRDSDFRNSVVSVYYKVKDMKFDDEIYLVLIRELLTSPSSRLLNKKLRYENDYVYSSFVINYSQYGVLGIVASINKNNYDDVVLKIKETINDLKDEKLVSNLLNNILERKRVGLIRLLDDKSTLFQEAITKDLGFDYISSEYYEKFSKINAHDVSLFIDRLILDTVYLLKEEEHE